MKRNFGFSLRIALLFWLTSNIHAVYGDEFSAGLPENVRVVWNRDSAYRETTDTRQRICINGLWRWQPATVQPASPPTIHWGYFKVPGCWPGITDYMQKDCQSVVMHPHWIHERMSDIRAAWYERELTVPIEWQDRRIALSVEYLNSLAVAFVDGKQVGELRFPGGQLDLTSHCVPGHTHRLTLHVTALPLQAVMQSYADSNSAREVQGRVERRGLCGDVFLTSLPVGEHITDLKVDTSIRNQEIRFEVAMERLNETTSYSLDARVTQDGQVVRQFNSLAFRTTDLKNGRFAFSAKWLPNQLWDLHTPANMFEVQLMLRQAESEPANEQTLDTTHPQRFGFREFWIDGKDFFLNGSRIFLSAVPLDNAQVGAAWASYHGARESFRRLKSFGINFVYTHNYGCEPGSHLSFAEILRAADDEGMLMALSQPHFSHYDWRTADADGTNGYARHAEFYVRAAQNHPAVVAYSMSHNACGYAEDMNPDKIDGLHDPRTASYERRNADLALRAQAIVNRLDPQRVVYHHAGGDLGAMHTVNFYPNFVPIQEMSDWFEHWSTVGAKPAFPCEYGAPFLWDWAMYRGWYQGEREFGSAAVPWDFCLAEWNSQFIGDQAFQISEFEKANLRWEAKQFRAGRLWHRWDYPKAIGSDVFEQRYSIIARYITDNWRAFRTWGLSAYSPWEHGAYWRLRTGVNRGRQQLPVDWEGLQRPGFSPDFLDQRYERMDLAYETTDWEPTAAAQALLRNNLPLLAYIAGKPNAFTSKDHLFVPGESFLKQLIVINNSRQMIDCTCSWSLDLPDAIHGQQQVSVATGNQSRVPISFEIPPTTAPGTYQLTARFDFSNGQSQDDSLQIHVLAGSGLTSSRQHDVARIALFDPHGETAMVLRRADVKFQMISADTDLKEFEQLIVGKNAITVDQPAPDISRVRNGLRVVIFEQTAKVLEKRFGFRVAEYGLREVFARVPDHQLLSGIRAEHLRDWRGSATLLSPQLEYELRPRHGPTVRWCDIEVPRLWRCGNRGNVASVLIEKPACGDFRPIVDGGFSLQYSPLLEYREGQGLILFCQLDVTGRTASDPVADTLLRNLLDYASTWQPSAYRTVVYVGEDSGKAQLISAGFQVQPFDETLSNSHVLVVGPQGGNTLAKHSVTISPWLESGGKLLAIGLDQRELEFLPTKVLVSHGEHIAAFFAPFSADSVFSGIGPADVHNRDPRPLPLIQAGATIFGDGVLACRSSNSTAAGTTSSTLESRGSTRNIENIVFCQLAPWNLGDTRQWNLKKTFRRSSFLVTRLLANLGASTTTPILDRFHTPVDITHTAPGDTPRWRTGLYLDEPEEWDDPYRFFRW